MAPRQQLSALKMQHLVISVQGLERKKNHKITCGLPTCRQGLILNTCFVVVLDIEQGRLNVQKAETTVSLMLYLAQNNKFYKISQFKNSLQHLREREVGSQGTACTSQGLPRQGLSLSFRPPRKVTLNFKPNVNQHILHLPSLKSGCDYTDPSAQTPDQSQPIQGRRSPS